MLETVAGVLTLTMAVGLTLAGILVILIWKKDLTRKVSYLRLFIQIASLAMIFYSFTMALWLSVFLIVIFAATLFSGRFFCGWICPFGLYMDLVALLRKAVGVRYRILPVKINWRLHQLRYILALVILVSPLLLGALSFNAQSGIFALFLRGPFRPLNILLSPLEPLIVPWSGVLGSLGVVDWSFSYPYVRDFMFYLDFEPFTSVLVYIFIALTLAGTFVFRRFWCRFCPSAISIAALNRFKGFKWAPLLHIGKVEEKCTKCGICKRVCPVQVNDVYDKKGGDINTALCLNCFRCVEMCPYGGCLSVKLAGKNVFQSRNWLEPSRTE
jgi:polyferredoxin